MAMRSMLELRKVQNLEAVMWIWFGVVALCVGIVGANLTWTSTDEYGEVTVQGLGFWGFLLGAGVGALLAMPLIALYYLGVRILESVHVAHRDAAQARREERAARDTAAGTDEPGVTAPR